MLKRLVLLLLEFGAGVAGNLVAGLIQQDQWSNLFTPPRLLGTLGGAALMLLILAWLESERALSWNWPWHRFWYLREALGDPDLRRWEADFARLEVAQRLRKVPAAEVIAEGQRQDLVEVLRDLIAGRRGEVRRALVLGEPGSGKTTGLERLTLDLAREGARRLGVGRPMPVLVRLGNFQKGKLLEYVGQAMRHGTRGGSGKVLGKGIEELVEQGRVVLLFDALDEALGERRERVLGELGDFLKSRAYADVPVVITSRTREEPGGRLAGLSVFEIQDLSDEAVEVFIRAYKRPEHSEEEIRERLERHRLLEPEGLGRNPFWLRLIVESGAFEGNKGQILNQAVDNLLTREWEKPEAERAWRRMLPRDDQLQETKWGLAWLGYRMSAENQVVLDGDRALAELGGWLKGRVGVEELRPQDVLGLGRDAQVLVYEPGPVRFRHRLLQEFMTAWALTDGLLTPEFLERCVRDTDWWETLLMLGGLVQDHGALVRAVLGDGRDNRRLFLAVGLLRSVDELDREVECQVTAALVESLRWGVTPEYKRAAVELANIAGDEVVEALRGLLREDNRMVKEGAVEILGEIKGRKSAAVLASSIGDEMIADQVVKVLVAIGEPAVELLINALRDEDSQGRKRTAQALGEIGDARAVQPLITALRDKDPEVRLLAAQALVAIGEPAVEPLIVVLRDEDQDVRLLAAQALVAIGELAVESLVEVLQDKDNNARLIATLALGEIRNARAVEPLIRTLQDEDEAVCQAAAEALGKIGKPAVEPLNKALHDEEGIVRLVAAKALGEIGEPAVEPLSRALHGEKNRWVRMIIALTLRDIGDVRAVEPFIMALQDRSLLVRPVAALALGKMRDPRAVRPLIGVLRDRNWLVRLIATWALGNIRDVRTVEPLVEMLRDRNCLVRIIAALALTKIGEPVVESLIGALQDKDSNVRQGAANALGDIKDIRAVGSLITALGDEDRKVRLQVAGALGKIGNPQAVGPLIGALRDKDWEVRREAAEALGKIKNVHAVEPLIEALRDENWQVREAVTKALGEIGDPRALLHLESVAREDKAKYLLGPSVADAAREAIERIRAAQQMGNGQMKPPE